MYKKIPISKEKSYLAVLKILNFLTNMTEVELDIIATMLSNEIVVLSKEGRRLISSAISKDSFTLNNHIKRMKDKGILIKNEKDTNLTINSNLVSIVEDSLKDGKIELELCL